MISRIGRRISIWCLAALFASSIALAQQPEVLVELERKSIFEGESVRYSVLLNHCEESAVPTLPDIPGVAVKHAGYEMASRVLIINGRRSSFGGPRHQYILTPKRSGEITIPAPTVVVDKKTYRGQTLTLQVVPPNQQDLAVLETSTSRKTIYPLQPFQLRLTIAIKGIPEPYTNQDPLQIAGELGETPALEIRWADDEELPDGVKPDSPALRWLNGLVQGHRRASGFSINDLRMQPIGFGLGGMGLGGRDPFSLFDPKRAVFRPEPRRVKRKDANGRTVDYWEYTFERTLTATKVGTISFGPVILKGSLVSRVNSSAEPLVEEIFAIAKSVDVEVRSAPAEGRPNSYIGAVGRFQADANLTPTTVKVGDPMTLSLRIHGTGALDDVTAPKLEQTPAVAESFKVYEATEESADGERLFKYSLRPKKAGVRQFPPIELAYFDFDREQYVTMRTEPISIEVAESDRLADQDIAMSKIAAAVASPVEASAGGIFANITDPHRVYDQRVHPDRWFLFLGSMAGVFVVCGLVARRVERQRNDPVRQRRRMATKRANAGLAEARRLAAAGSRRETVETLSAAITRFVADAVGSAETGLTARDVGRKLAAIGLSEALVSHCQRQLDELDATRYGDGVHPLNDQVRSTEQLLSDLVRELRKRKLAV